MILNIPIEHICAREILDSRGNPTIEAEVMVQDDIVGRAAVPSGASTGSAEALELRDGDKRYQGKGVMRAVKNVNENIADALVGMNVLEQRALDNTMIRLDGTLNKKKLGANAILSVSLAAAKAAARAVHLPLYRYLGGINFRKIPVPMMNILNGGKHADNSLDIQEFMIMPPERVSFKEGLRMCAEVYSSLKSLLKEKGFGTAVGDEGGFAPELRDSKEALELITEAVKAAGYQPGEDILLALDAAASEFYNKEEKKYEFTRESEKSGKKVARSVPEMIQYYKELIHGFPIASVEDPLDEEDWEGWRAFTAELGNEVAVVGDDLFVTNQKRLKKGIRLRAANAILVKVNQIGTLTEAIDVVELAKKAGYATIVSHRSGETEDTTIADLAMALSADRIKSGAPCRSERVAKYNRLLRIEEEIE